MNQEKLIQLRIIEQEANQLEQQLQIIEQHISDMQKINNGLDEIEKTQDKEILANIGKGIYIPAQIKSKDLIVEIGSKNFVKKTIPETKKIIEEQLKKLIAFKHQVIEKVGEMQEQMNMLMSEEREDMDEEEKEE
ncbi:MAG: prefoldin subunit alpha [Nanoarchaeota archaeon]